MNLEIVALADPWRLARERANAKVRQWFGRDARQCVSYRELLTWDNLDAVMIASPDHLHTTHVEAAARAGKHMSPPGQSVVRPNPLAKTAPARRPSTTSPNSCLPCKARTS